MLCREFPLRMYEVNLHNLLPGQLQGNPLRSYLQRICCARNNSADHLAKIHPKATLDLPSPTTSHDPTATKPEVFTVWMKSLIMNSKGCTVFDSSGGIVYRVDNYDCERSSEVCLMDREGKVLITILKKKCSLFKTWKGYDGSIGSGERRTLFQVKKPLSFKKRESLYEVKVWTDKNQPSYYFIQGHGNSKSACKITNRLGGLMAEVKEKKSSLGVSLGDDVLTMSVEPNVDHSLAAGLLVVYGLFNRSL
ncbi:protein LURP-one-related 11-like [Rhodamnia argentea]|uniref:Protein LURP-one-related 11-like n=1 Tax=Rhodamnia argentea TaxID=178133 RepID=A0A8B8PUK2_9MYRT|nr:protein LURP-one-related 11-like [Rhodamnia argentea]